MIVYASKKDVARTHRVLMTLYLSRLHVQFIINWTSKCALIISLACAYLLEFELPTTFFRTCVTMEIALLSRQLAVQLAVLHLRMFLHVLITLLPLTKKVLSNVNIMIN